MEIVAELMVVVAAFAGSALLTGGVRRYAQRKAILDVPNHRSSHTVPTPRGGGLAICVTVLLVVSWLGWQGRLPQGFAAALLGGGIAVAAIGWIDDHRPLKAVMRVLVHLAASAWAVYAMSGVATVDVGFGPLHLGVVFGSSIAVVLMTWLVNLYNFMDGTDGIAGTQAACAGIAGAALFCVGGEKGLGMVSLAVAAAAAGFLRWNWPPARIFMGDVGSYFLGYTFAVLALAGEKTGAAPALLWSVILSVFLWDATFTLIRRALAGERWYAAHRSHAYQRLVQMGWSHRRVALAVLGYNVCVLWPLAWLGMVWNNGVPLICGVSALLFAAVWTLVQRRYQKQAAYRVTSA